MQLMYEGNWHTYEEWGGIKIFEDLNGCIRVQEGGYSVYSDPKEPDWEDLYVVSLETALELINDWERIEKENEEYWEGVDISF